MDVSTHLPFTTALMEEPFPKMGNDDFRVVRIQSQEFNGLFGNESVRGSVDTIFTDFIFIVVFIWDRIHICFLRHRLMESCIKYGYVWFAWHQFHTCADSHKVCRIVKRSQITALFDNRNYFVIDDTGIRDLCSSVQYTVTDSFYLIQAL